MDALPVIKAGLADISRFPDQDCTEMIAETEKQIEKYKTSYTTSQTPRMPAVYSGEWIRLLERMKAEAKDGLCETCKLMREQRAALQRELQATSPFAIMLQAVLIATTRANVTGLSLGAISDRTSYARVTKL